MRHPADVHLEDLPRVAVWFVRVKDLLGNLFRRAGELQR